jgi:hypothetical protein
MLLWAESEGTIAGIITAFVAAFAGLAGLVGWIVRKMLDQTIPGQQRTFQETMTAVLVTAAADAKEARTLYREQIIAERVACDVRMREVLVAIERTQEEQYAGPASVPAMTQWACSGPFTRPWCGRRGWPRW